MIAIGIRPLPTLGGLFRADRLIPSRARPECVNVIGLDGRVMAVEVNGTITWRPAGTDGPWEWAVEHGFWLVYAPDPDQPLYAFPYFPRVP